MPVAEERVTVRHALVCTTGDTENGFAAPHVREREGETVDRDPVARLDESLSYVSVPVGIGSPGQPPAVRTSLRRPERGIGEDVLGAYILPPSERLEDGAARELV